MKLVCFIAYSIQGSNFDVDLWNGLLPLIRLPCPGVSCWVCDRNVICLDVDWCVYRSRIPVPYGNSTYLGIMSFSLGIGLQSIMR